MNSVMFNSEKHHLQTIANKTCQYISQGEKTLPQLLDKLVNKGVHRGSYNGVIDVYFGSLLPEQIKAEVAIFLTEHGISDFEGYRQFLETHGQIKRRGYYTSFTLSDGTLMTLRIADDENQYVHVHPGRYSPNTFRVKAYSLKTAILTLYLAKCRGSLINDISLINEARRYLDLPPVQDNAASIYATMEKLQQRLRPDGII